MQDQSEDFNVLPSSGAFFTSASRFVISGGTFNSINNYAPSPSSPSGFRTIPLGDIDLLHEIQVKSDELGEERCMVDRFSGRGCVRRIYSARLGGSESQRMTVATYHGPDAKEQLQRHILNYASIRHPNIMQLYGIAINGGIAAMVFHDDLIPYKQFLSRFRHSLILTTYIVGHCSMEYEEASDYLRSLCPRRPLYYDERTFWIRRSTGHLCADLTADWRRRKLHFTPGYFRDDSILRLGSFALEDPNFEATVISSITEDDYHRLCSRYPMVQSRDLTISTQATIRPGAIIFCSTPQPDREALFEIAHCPHLAFVASAWNNTGEATGRAGTVMANSWVRYSYRGAHVDYIDADMWAFTAGDTKSWMTQANHIFSRLQTTSDFDNYIFVDEIRFHLQLIEHPSLDFRRGPEGYLFVCPVENFEVSPGSFRWPNCPAYWSFDPTGVDPLDAQEAHKFGFPTIHIQTSIHGQSWASNVYAGLRQFHEAKGFSPESQDVAGHLGYRLYELSNWMHEPFAYVDDNCEEDGGAMCWQLGHFPNEH